MSKKNTVNSELEQQRLERSKRYQSYRKTQKSEEKPENFKGTLTRLIAQLAPYKGRVIIVFIAASLGTLLSLPSADFMGDLVDAFNAQIAFKIENPTLDMQFGECLKIILKVFGLYFGNAACMYVQTILMAEVSQKFICNIRGQINKKLSVLPLSYYDKATKGEILSKIVNDCDNISGSLQNNITTVLTSAIQLVGVGIYMFVLNWRMALIAVCIIPISTVVTRVIAGYSKKLFRNYWDRVGEMNGHIEEMYTGNNIVRIFNKKNEAIEEFNDIAEQLCKSTYKANFVSGLINPILRLFNNLNYVLICFVGATLVVRTMQGNPIGGGATVGLIITFTSYSNQFASPINSIARIINTIQSTLASAERVFEIIDTEEEPADNPKYTLENCEGHVEFKDVDFRYLPDKPLINNLNIDVKPGSVVAIVGPTGAGKTTIVNLLMRFYDVNAGKITVDGIDIREISRNNLRSEFGMVLQDTWLFKGTIRENIAYGRDGATEEEIIAASKAASFDEYVMQLPDGYDTMLEEDGTNISQGQRQLLTIARAILSDPKIMILDEATSSVDTKTEVKIQKALDMLMVGRTNFVIAHRLSTIKNADMILVMRRGTIVEKGTHDELLAADGFYAGLYRSQYTGGIPPEDIE